MASTRISNDKVRIYKEVQQSTDVGKHILNVPGNGLDVPFIEDPQVRMQLWGANRVNDVITVENSLMNIDRPLMRGCHDCKKSYYTNPDLSRMNYSQESFGVTDTSIIDPAWNLRDKEDNRAFGYPEEANDAHLFSTFHQNLGTRTFEKDLYNQRKC